MEHIPFEFIDKVIDTICKTPHHTYLLLTKRPKRALEFCQWWLKKHNQTTLPENIHLGVTVCNQQEADEKIPTLLQIPATKRWISIEPMLEKIDIMPFTHIGTATFNKEKQTITSRRLSWAYKTFDWVVLGGESGAKARPMHPDWARSVRDQCEAAGVPFYMKQMSGRKPIPGDLRIREMPK